MPVIIATWNVNSVKSRLQHLLEWLKADKPDIVLLQELKCVDEAFPSMEIEELGYNLAIYGEKTYNGVAILSKFPLDDITRGLPGDETDTHARYIEAVVSLPFSPRLRGELEGGGNSSRPHPTSPASGGGEIMRVASVYVPNGQDTASDKFQYKMRFLDRLNAHVKTLLAYEELLVIGGDYNIAPDESDVHDPKAWEGSVLTHDEVRLRLNKIMHQGMYNAIKLIHPVFPKPSPSGRGLGEGASSPLTSRSGKAPHPGPLPQGEGVIRHSFTGEGIYSWWDYRASAFVSDNGLLIDHLLLSPHAADKLTDAYVKKDLRALEKASDHAPVVAELTLMPDVR